MTTQTRQDSRLPEPASNEAAERLRDFRLACEANGDLWPMRTDAWLALEDSVLSQKVALDNAREICEKRVAAERRATVEDAKAALRQAYGPDAPPEYDRSSTVSGSLDDICDLLDGVAR